MKNETAQLTKAIAAMRQFEADNKHLVKNIATFSTCAPNPFHEDAQKYWAQFATLRDAICDATWKCYVAGVRPATIRNRCAEYVNRFNLPID